jgi:proteasome lid subunit RPN8/RPN11
MAIELTRAQVDEMIAHAHADYPNECCGLLAGRGQRVEYVFRGRNVDQSPYTYRLDPQEQLHFFKDVDARGMDLVAIYHSHTQSPAYPSRTDVAKAVYPDAAYLIVSLEDSQAPVVRAFRVRDGVIAEEELAIR